MTTYQTITIVSGGDANYFDLLKDLAHSIRDQAHGKEIQITYLDGGLDANHIAYFKELNIQILDPGWCNPLAAARHRNRDYLKINIAKCHLDQLLPEADIIVWIDADAWLQNLHALDLFALVANKNKMAIVSQASRLQTHHLSFKPKLFGWVELRNILYKNAQRAGIKGQSLKNLMARPTLNAGTYALSVKAPHWERFRYWQNAILKKGRLFTSDQLAFALAIFEDALPYEALPDTCNYMGPWRWNEANKIFVDFFAPYDTVSIVHLAGQDSMRENPSTKISMLDMDDRVIKKSLRYKESFEA